MGYNEAVFEKEVLRIIQQDSGAQNKRHGM
jgi:hypothetical protein